MSNLHRTLFAVGAEPSPVTLSDAQQLVKGELNAAISSALVGIYREYLGRGPARAFTFHHGNVLVTLMDDVLTHAEKSLSQSGQEEPVYQMRHRFQKAMEADFRTAVERLTSRKVLSFISGNDIDPDVAAELFILDEPL